MNRLIKIMTTIKPHNDICHLIRTFGEHTRGSELSYNFLSELLPVFQTGLIADTQSKDKGFSHVINSLKRKKKVMGRARAY